MVIDILLVITVLYGFYLGFSKGVIGAVFMVLSLFFGFVAAVKIGPATTEFLEKAFNNENPLMLIVGFLLTFVLVMVLIRMFARGLENILQSARINILNQLLGGMLLAGILVLLLSVLVWFGDQAHMIDRETKRTSFSYQYLETFPSEARTIAHRFKPMFEEFWNASLDMMDKLEDMSIEQTESTPVITDQEE